MNFIINYLEKRRARKSVHSRVHSVSGFIDRNWKNADYYNEIIGLKTRRWNLMDNDGNDFMLEHGRQTRADLIQLYKINSVGEANEVGTWVDQSHAYPGFLGIADIIIEDDLSIQQIEAMVKNYERKH